MNFIRCNNLIKVKDDSIKFKIRKMPTLEYKDSSLKECFYNKNVHLVIQFKREEIVL